MAAGAAVLVGGGGLLVVLSLLARREPRPAAARSAVIGAGQLAPVLTMLAGSLALAAGLIHLAAAPAHVEELGPLGWGFVGAAIFQGAWALSYAIQPSRGIALVGMAGTVAILGAWAWTRIVGLPVGPFAGAPEPIGVPDGAATAFELLLVVLLAARLTGAEARLRAALWRAPSLPAIAAVPAIGMVFLATTLAVSLALGHGHAPDEGHETPAGSTADHRR